MIRHTAAKDPELHVCKHCNMSAKHMDSLFDHILRKHPDCSEAISRKIYECEHCAFKITKRSKFIRHMAKHNNRKPCECINCDASFKTKLYLDDHILKKHPEFAESVSYKVHECIHCEYRTIHARDLDRHMMHHTGTTKFTCEKCHALFTSKQWFHNHILQKHPELIASVSSKIHDCTHCAYKTTNARSLATHLMKHTGVKLSCTNCDALFTTQLGLDNHILQKHLKFTASIFSKTHECKQCEFKTPYLPQLSKHMIKHTRVKLTCTKCDASFTTKQRLDNHILQKHPELTGSVSRKIHECTYCKYKTTFESELAGHILKHTGTKLTCTKCDRSFTDKRSLDNHILQKHPESTASLSRKIHECTHCEYKTMYAYYLNRHIMKHTGAKFKCTRCDASFTSTRSLDDHIIQKHPEFIDSVSRKIHECKYCEYKTTQNYRFKNHSRKHIVALE
ncbi:unnamed protein product [Acanthoscelides obtectus]|uniref:C2H2-type domain-containing protein n=1 Tax=Acanthoscelides obtectus TaxID=200917 RepID=A0A9P0MKS3_ACAOB|nr:unnamed protein product [Acanthoscelides obtectus]CAK1676198.1 Zinc finger protein 26 [Acanthoscelides obtectus]